MSRPPFSRSTGVDADRAEEARQRELDESGLTHEDLRLVRVMRAIAVEEVSHVQGVMLTKEDVAEAVTSGMRALLKDDRIVADFWAHGFRHLSETSAEAAAKWIGRRVIIAAAGLVLAAVVFLSAKFGALK